MRKKSAPIQGSFPLEWPTGYPRMDKEDRDVSRLRRGTIRTAFKELEDQFRLLGAKHIVVSSNLPLKSNNLPYLSGKTNLEDPGVAVYFDLDNEQHCMTCDRWDLVKDNLLALADTVDCMRKIERRGSSQTMKRAFSAFKALPPSEEDWPQVLGVEEDCTFDEAQKAYRAKASKVHPDKGGNEVLMTRLNKAWERAKGVLE